MNYKQLGEWENEFATGEKLALVAGRIASIDTPAAGVIELTTGLSAFFVPSGEAPREGLLQG